MDLNYTGDTTSGREGIDLLARVQALDGLLPVVVMTGWGSVDLAVEAMRRGVRDFVQKPWDNGQLVATLRAEIEDGRARRQRVELEQRELDEARRIQRKLLPATLPQIDGCEIAALVAAGVRRRRRLLRRDRVRPDRLGAVDRRRRRQGHSGGAADVEPAGRRARVRHRRDAHRPNSASRSTASCAATSPKAGSSASSTASSTRDLGR